MDQDTAILRDLCTINGVNYDHLERGAGEKLTKLESFFFGTPYIPSKALTYFPALTELKIVNQKFTQLSGLESCVNLTQLWVCEGQLQCIEGLSACTNLTSLYLYTNRIRKIEGLDTLAKLRTLWLNGNLIPAIEGLDCQTALSELNLAHNKISAIGSSLDHMSQLVELNLSGNLLSSLSDLIHLSSLPHLTTLALCDPLYPPNPVAALCNYSTHILYHLPTLHWLDGVNVASDELHLLVEGVVQRKKRFYRMKTHHIRMTAMAKQKEIRERTEAAKQDIHSNIREVTRQLKSAIASGAEQVSQLNTTLEQLDKHLSCVESEGCEECEAVRGQAEELCERWSMELESGGNVRFILGAPPTPWYLSCFDIVHSRLTVTQVVKGVEVLSVTKVENRLQYTKFNNKLQVELQRDEFASLPSWKTLLDYLFIVWEPGVRCGELCGGGGQSYSPKLTNSVNMADAARIAELSKGQRSREGELLLCKVFVGLNQEVKNKQSLCVSGEGVNSVYYVGEGGQREWMLANSDLYLPEYIVSVSYITPPPPSHKEDVPSLPVSVIDQTHPLRLAMLDEPTLLEHARAHSLASIKELCFHDNHLRRFRLASSLSSLVKLILSFNELVNVEDLRNMPCLEELDVSFNKLTSLDGLKGVPRLKSLDLRGNLLANTHQLLTTLRKTTPILDTLDTRYNPWNVVWCGRVLALGCLKNLKMYNGRTVTDEETRVALRQTASSHLSLTTLMNNAHTHPHTPHTLTLCPLSQILHTDTRYRPSHLNPQNNWPHTVTSVCVNGVGLQRLSCLEGLCNLRWLSLANNCLTSVELLLGCSRLEELILDNNHITLLPTSLHTLSHLTHLSLAHNLFTSLPSLLPHLEYLDISYNQLSSLDSIKQCVSLVELYASGNVIATTRSLLPLKALSSLSVCDLSHNPVVERSEYRHYVVYHCTSLKSLDSIAVETAEVVLARERMGGRLCQDLIYERHPDTTDLSTIKELDVTHAGIKVIDLSPVVALDNLASLNLEHNSLSSFSGLVHLNNLKVLCLNHNRVEGLVSSRDPLPTNTDTLMPSLQVLHLAYNGIHSLPALQLGRIPSLRALFLQGNKISTVDGLQGLNLLTELVLDRNKVKSLEASSLSSLSGLRELHLEENRLKDLSHFSPLPCLQRLYLGSNKIQEFSQLEKLGSLPSVVELSLVSNPVSRRLQHRGLLLHLLPSLLSLDGVLVSSDERIAAQNTFTPPLQEEEANVSGLNHSSLLKVMNMPFGHQKNRPPVFTERRRK